ncbi:hypothetical protein ABC304_09705 [Microbacterium sp. 1P10UB]|uniref:hypothetical protein n=1 Tax=unclassified Microbacterium TaxID=2609290 RepID=UPI0039A23F3B
MDAFALLDVPPLPTPARRELVAMFRASLADKAVPVILGDVTDDDVLAAFAEIVPDALAHQQALGIPAEVTAETLRDIGGKHRSFGARTEVPWLLGILRGDVISVGRLQVERRSGSQGHGLHIPELGPLVPAAVDASLGRAHDLLGATDFTCTSWLLEPALAAALPGTNMAAFARRFTLDADTTAPSDAGARSAAKFVFGRPLADVLDPAAVTPRTRLEHLVVQRLREGPGWSEPSGTLTFAAGSLERKGMPRPELAT